MFPYEGQVECFGAEEGMYHQIYPILTDALLEPAMDEDGEMRLLGIEATLSMRFFLCTEEKDTDIRRFIFTENMLCSSVYAVQGGNVLMQNHSKCKIAERLSLPEIKDDILQICYSDARIQVEQMTVQDTGIQIEGSTPYPFYVCQTGRSDTICPVAGDDSIFLAVGKQ